MLVIQQYTLHSNDMKKWHADLKKYHYEYTIIVLS